MTGVQQVEVAEADDGMRLDRWFKQHFPQIPHGRLQKLLRTGQVRAGGAKVKADHRIQTGEVIRVPPIGDSGPVPKPNRPRLTDEDRSFMQSLVIYEDDDILALNKPAGLAVQGGAGQTRHIDGMLDAFNTRHGDRPRLVHRLDRDTGGVLVLAKTRAMAATLSEAFRQHKVEKTYWALTVGVPNPLAGTIDSPISKMPTSAGEKVAPNTDGKPALTDYQVVEAAGTRAAFVALRPHTGRTHQLRVHLSLISTPIVGDRKYGGARAVLEGIAPKMHLFCRTMVVPRRKGPPLSITAPLAGPMAETWGLFSFAEPDGLEWPT
ncbi:MAG: RluA family pseudouridine synthase [Parvularcula sp.]